MAQKFMSPGVFTTEVDLSFLAQGVAGIGAVVIGRTPKGPAFAPTFVNGLDAFAAVFGDPNPDYQLTYAAKNYLKNSNALTVVRVLGHDDGTDVSNGMILPRISAVVDSVTAGNVLAVLHHTGTLTVTGVALSATDFILSCSTFSVTASFVKTASNYIGKVLNTDPTKYSTYDHYLYSLFSYANPVASASWNATTISGATYSYDGNYQRRQVSPVLQSMAAGTGFL